MAEPSRTSKKRKPNIPLEIPVRELKPLTPEELSVSFARTASQAAKKALKGKFSKCVVEIERGLDFKDLGREVEAIFRSRNWMELAELRRGEVNMTLVAEFYSLIATYESEDDKPLESVPLRTREVPFTPQIINATFGIPDIPASEDYYSVWNLDEPADFDHIVSWAQYELDPIARWHENRFSYGNCMRDMKAIKRFISATLYPSRHLTSFGKEDLCLAWAMVNDIPVNVGQVMYKRALEFAQTAKKGSYMPFPCLISQLCRQVGVPELSNDVMIKVDEELIGPSLPALPTGKIDFMNPNRPRPTPPTSQSTTDRPSSSRQSQTTSSITNEMFQSLAYDVNRTNANMAINMERNRQWSEDLRQGIIGLHQMHVLSNPALARMSIPHCQSEPYTMPEMIPPMPPQPHFQPMSHAFGSTSGVGDFSTGFTAAASSRMEEFGGVSSTTSWSQAFTDVTTGMSSIGLDSSVSMSTQFQAPFFESTQDPSSSQSMPSSSFFDIRDEDE